MKHINLPNRLKKFCAILVIILAVMFITFRQKNFSGIDELKRIVRDAPTSKLNGDADSDFSKRKGKKSERVSDRLRLIFNSRQTLLSKKEADNYLRISGRTGETVSIAFLMSRGGSFLTELRAFPDSDLALAVIAQFDEDLNIAKQAAENLIKNCPEDPKGYYGLANLHLQEGDIELAIDHLSMAAERSGEVSIFNDECYEGMVNALKLNGSGEMDAKGKLIDNFQLLQDFMMPSANMRMALKPLLKEWPEEKKAQLASLILLIAQKNLNQDTSQWPWGTSFQSFNEMTALRYLPEDLEYGENSTVGDRFREIQKQVKLQVENEKREIEILSKSSDETIDRYFTELSNHGAMAARDWLLNGGVLPDSHSKAAH